ADSGTGRQVAGVEPALKPNLEQDPRSLHVPQRLVRGLQVERDRLLAETGQARSGGELYQRCVRRGGGGDDKRLGTLFKHCLGRLGLGGADGGRQGGRAFWIGV